MKAESNNEITDFPELLTEQELIEFLGIPAISCGQNQKNVIQNLKRTHRLPCIHLSRKPSHPLNAIRNWIGEKLTMERE